MPAAASRSQGLSANGDVVKLTVERYDQGAA
jgi:hypothetical protein